MAIQPTAELPGDAANWRGFFAGWRAVVLVANSEHVDPAAVAARFGPDTLFVFFNRTYKVLGAPFARPALVVARSSPAGANIVYRREVAAVAAPFAGQAFRGFLNLRAGPDERFSPAVDFGGHPAGWLDLAGADGVPYPVDRLPTSGFALAAWLAAEPGPGLHLEGFTARLGERWKLFGIHDWSFEQTMLRLLGEAGYLSLGAASAGESAALRFARRFPRLDANRIGAVATDVLADRLGATDAAVARLASLTRWQGRLRDAVHRLKPRTRKARVAARTGEPLAKPGSND